MKQNSLYWKGIALTVIVLFIGMGINPLSATLSVEKSPTISLDGNTLYVGGSGPNNYSKIQYAIDNASQGDAIFVFNGTYYENLEIKIGGISLVGEDKNTTIIDGIKRENVILVLEDSVSIKDFTVQNSSDDRAGIACQILFNPPRNIENVHISNCIIKNNNFGILFNNVSNSSLSNCHLYNLTSQSVTIRLLSEDISINNCTINNNGYEAGGEVIKSGCIYIDGENDYYCSNIIICNNDINNIVGDGIAIFKTKNVTIFNNNIYENSIDGVRTGLTKNCEIHHNTIYENTNNGIGIFDSDVKIFNNHIYDNGIGESFDGGIFLQDCINSVTVYDNNIETNNQYGLYILRSSFNSITKNNFNQNKCNAYFLQFSLLNRWNENYWTDWIGLGPKIIKGSLGAVMIRWMNFDWHPAREPYEI